MAIMVWCYSSTKYIVVVLSVFDMGLLPKMDSGGDGRRSVAAAEAARNSYAHM